MKYEQTRAFRFGAFEVDAEAGELRKNGLKIQLQEQPFRLLILLLERTGTLVTRDELQQELWPADTFVEFDRSLNTAINKVRDALGDSAGSPRFIETVPRRGYRFVAPVETVHEAPAVPRKAQVAAWQAALAGALATTIGVFVWQQFRRPEHLPMLPPRTFDLAIENLTFYSAPAISPDGRYIAFVTEDHTAATRMYVYDLQRAESHQLPNTEGADRPFWSPDGEFIGFAVADELRKVTVAGGVPSLICETLRKEVVANAAWSLDGNRIQFTTLPALDHYEVSARGGHPRLIDPQGIAEPTFMALASVGRLLLFVANPVEGQGQITMQNLDTGRQQVLDAGVHPVYSSTGHVIYQSACTEAGLWALAVSPTLGRLGQPFPIAPNAIYPQVSKDGTLVYLNGGRSEQARLVWLDRRGKKMAEIGQPQKEIHLPSLSPDGRFVGVEGVEGKSKDVWIHDVAQSTKRRLTQHYPAVNSRAYWSPDGKQVAFWSDRNGNADVFIQAVDGRSEAKAVMASARPETPEDWSADGNYIAVTVTTTHDQLWYLRRKPDGSFDASFFADTRSGLYAAKFSPDTRFIAYVSSDTGKEEVYVQPFPQGGRTWQVSAKGGTQPRWSRDGKELYYVEGETLYTVPISTTPTFSAGEARRLFSHHGLRWQFVHQAYDVSADGARFVVVEPVGRVPPLTIRVVQNWFAEFQDRQRKN
jgi:Tol biopolymer transport system component/DNA-binding winged helix-turn-helix (wHTH) protein